MIETSAITRHNNIETQEKHVKQIETKEREYQLNSIKQKGNINDNLRIHNGGRRRVQGKTVLRPCLSTPVWTD